MNNPGHKTQSTSFGSYFANNSRPSQDVPKLGLDFSAFTGAHISGASTSQTRAGPTDLKGHQSNSYRALKPTAQSSSSVSFLNKMAQGSHQTPQYQKNFKLLQVDTGSSIDQEEYQKAQQKPPHKTSFSTAES